MKSKTTFWAEHVINKFGAVNARNFALTWNGCPCAFLNLHCLHCIYSDADTACMLCQANYDYDNFMSDDYDHPRWILRRRMRVMKRKIRRKTRYLSQK